MDSGSSGNRQRLPQWLHRGIPDCKKTKFVKSVLTDLNLNTVCDGAKCPNKGECYSKNTATFLILGNKCTRSCLFCAIEHDDAPLIDKDEPAKVAKAIQLLGLTYVVITSVTRDDLPDGGAGHFVETINKIRQLSQHIKIEVLVPDFKGNHESIRQVLQAEVDVFNHNVEMVKSLYSIARPQASYQQSLNVINYAKEYMPDTLTKSGFMVGLGESEAQINQLLEDLSKHKCDIVTIGQYIQPTKSSLKVKKYYTEEEFLHLNQMARAFNFKKIVAGPLVRSSYKAFDSFSGSY